MMPVIDVFDASSETSSEYSRKENAILEMMKKRDKYFEVEVKKVVVDVENKEYEKVKIRKYGTGVHGGHIRNAVNGYVYNIVMGSPQEKMLFKVIDSTGRHLRKDPLMLYYDSPEQYEEHQQTDVDTEVKQKWYRRAIRLKTAANAAVPVV